ncbi:MULTISPECIES: DsbA family oxidoreductase [Enterobacterales]|jgi:predicted DsbA family dithiol-disulfide isomerase|nr:MULTISPECIES: DsbA family oxidoreductase [Pectobacteriaceae]MCI4068297.1 DsbA family oxidoreductase [Dickeya dianthicola]MCI4113460.1 DsbA family oxidoreductase [Dickeya dianthicola]MCI4118580.1 DsbA family oxidoreductase [Dickeya dianthicola]MCI4124932.1 DsbA family oxidoreductase [Dickeya dianthicola]MCI4191722.1 DsbA family oxidoreductase [Dickeya dianthicola]
MMKIEVWSDFACPYCYIGKRHLEQALSEFTHSDDVDVVFKVFELDPGAEKKVTTSTQGRIERKYGKSPQQAKEMIDHIVSMGGRVGLNMRYESVLYTNTFDAHRLTKFAETKGKGAAMSERLFRAYFTDNLPLADHDVLVKIAVELGLDRDETLSMLRSEAFVLESRQDEILAGKAGVNSVPCFVIDGKETLLGAQPKEYLLKTIEMLWADKEAAEITSEGNASACGKDECSI